MAPGPQQRKLAPSDQQPHREGSGDEAPAKKRIKATVACNECRTRRSKCTPGPDKCVRCTSLGLRCVFEENSDRRRRNVYKEELEKIEPEHQLLLGIFAAIRACPTAPLPQLIEVIRSNASIAEVASYVSEHPEIFQKSEVNEDALRKEATTPTRQTLRLFNLVDQPLYSLHTKPWTTVTNDDYLVSHLTSLYFTWEHPFFVFLDKDLFLQDLVEGNTRFCSPMLVNAILAYATHMCRPMAGRGNPDGSKLGVQFSAEARRLWQLERDQDRRTLTTVQALLVMSATCAGEGKDRMSWLYINDATYMALDLKLGENIHRLIPGNSTEHQEMTRRSREITAWGLHYWQNVQNFSIQRKSPQPCPPSVEIPNIDGSGSSVWVPYPSRGDPRPSLSNEVFNAQCSLSVIASDVSYWMFEDGMNVEKADLTWDRALEFQGRLQCWRSQFPANLHSDLHNLPHTLLLVMNYYNILMTLFKPFIRARPPDHFSPTTGGRSATDSAARRALADHARCIRELVAIYRDNFGFEHALPYVLHILSTIAFHDLGNLDDPESRVSFMESIQAVRHMSLSWFAAKPILRMVELCAGFLKIELPSGANEVLASAHDERWLNDGIGQILKSYPLGSLRSFFHGTRLAGLLDTWEEDDEKEQSSEQSE